MLLNKILCIGNKSSDTNQLAAKMATQLGMQYHGLLDITNYELGGVYHTSIEDLSLAGINKIINQFDRIEVFDQHGTGNTEAYYQRLTLKNCLNEIDITYPTTNGKMLFVGCSHTAGVGHLSPDTVYTNLLAHSLDQTPMILGVPGHGNYLFEKLLNTYDLRDTSIVIQFSDIFRLRYYNSSGILIQKQGKDFVRKELDFFTKEKLTQDFLEMVNRIVIRLRDAGSKFVFFILTPQHHTESLINYKLSTFKEFCWIPDVHQDLADDKMHYGVKSHRLIADKLTARWNKLYAKK